MIDYFKVSIIINNHPTELGRTFYTYKQADDYCKDFLNRGECEAYLIEWSNNDLLSRV